MEKCEDQVLLLMTSNAETSFNINCISVFGSIRHRRKADVQLESPVFTSSAEYTRIFYYGTVDKKKNMELYAPQSFSDNPHGLVNS